MIAYSRILEKSLCWLTQCWSHRFPAHWTDKLPHLNLRGRSRTKPSNGHHPRSLAAPPSPLRQRGYHENISILSVPADTNTNCMLLRKLPAELRSAIWTYAIRGDKFCLITIPWKLTTAPYLDPAAFDAWDDMALSRYHAEIRSRCSASDATADSAIEDMSTDLRQSYPTSVFDDYFRPAQLRQSGDALPKHPPHNVWNSIRTLRLLKSSRFKMPYPHPRWRPYSPTFGDIWRLF